MLWHWYLVPCCHCCTKWLPQKKTEKLDVLLFHVAKMQLKRENGSVSLQISKREMRHFSPAAKEVFLSQSTRQSWEMCWVGREREAVPKSSWPSALVLTLLHSQAQWNLWQFLCGLNPWSQSGWSDFHRKTPYMWLLLTLFASLAEQICAPQICPLCIFASEALNPVHSLWKVTDWTWIWRGSFATNQGFLHL